MTLALSAVVQQYLTDLRLLNRSPRTIHLYQCVLGYFDQRLRATRHADAVPMTAVTLEAARGYVAELLDRDQMYRDHPLRKAQPQRLSAFTIHQHVRILRAFGNWLARNDYPNRLSKLDSPKLPKRLIVILSEEEIDRLFNAYGGQTHFGARWQAMMRHWRLAWLGT